MSVTVFESADDVAAAAAAHVAHVAAESIAERGVFRIALAGGSTPRRAYERLVSAPLAWPQVEIFFGDERHVGPDHPDSNYRMAREALLAHVPVTREHVHRIEGELAAAALAAQRYEDELLHAFGTPKPRFDLVLLGLGPDGHTASLFPGSPALEETTRFVVANRVDKFADDRITVTFPLLALASAVLFLVTGAEKAEALSGVLEGPPDRYPAQRVRPRAGTVRWFVDRAAASRLSGR